MLQTATSKTGRGGRRKLSWVFTEHGAMILASEHLWCSPRIPILKLDQQRCQELDTVIKKMAKSPSQTYSTPL
ncbi:MAG TPA: hypothetical protein VL171_03270 [Verrucomicrobiae bacterium]|nr:hypothetical protein [Verrucomicrobiae bacterium]